MCGVGVQSGVRFSKKEGQEARSSSTWLPAFFVTKCLGLPPSSKFRNFEEGVRARYLCRQAAR
jgi:hypothetical protein